MLSVTAVANGVAVGAGSEVVPWWSFGKTVLAATALALVRDGRLKLDAPLAGHGFSLRQLLQHRSGLPDYGGLAAYHEAVARGERPWPIDELVTRAGPPRFAPGAGWAHSNIGYLRVREVIEAAAGSCLEKALQRLVLGPLGVNDVRVAVHSGDLVGVGMGTAADYDPRWVYHGLLAGPLQSAVHVIDRLLGGDLLPPSLLHEMAATHPLGGPVPGRPWVMHGYALGLMVGTSGTGTPVLGHTGGGPGSVIAVYRSAATGRTAAAFARGADAAAVESAVFAAFEARPSELSVTSPSLACLRHSSA